MNGLSDIRHPMQRILELSAKVHPIEDGKPSILVEADNARGSMRISLPAYCLFLRNSFMERI